jgi:DNA-binding Lrp family transcriptional regulator
VNAAADLALLNPWQHGFPLQREPFAAIAATLGRSVDEVLAACARLQREGALGRIGGVFGPGAGGAALLCAMAVPPSRLQAVADIVSAHPGVNHNYERAHAINLWFVLTGPDAATVERELQGLEQGTGLRALRLPMQRAYRIDLGFDLHGAAPAPAARAARRGAPVAPADRPLAALVEQGLPLRPRPFDAWAQALGRSPEAVLQRLQDWLAHGTLKRFGTIVRHHELGFAANAMTVFDVPDDRVDPCGEALAHAGGVTLAYRRARAPGWPYNLYCMVHGRDHTTVRAQIDAARAAAGLLPCPHAVLFSRRRFKQTGGRYFTEAPHAALA